MSISGEERRVVLTHPCVGAYLLRDEQSLPTPQSAPPLQSPATALGNPPQHTAAPTRTPAPSSSAAPLAGEDWPAVLGRLTDQVRQIHENYRKSLAEMQEASVEIAMAVVQRIWRQAADAGRFPILPMVQELLAQLPGEPIEAVRLNPSDHSQWMELRKQGLPAQLASLPVVADPSMSPGQCRIECSAWGMESSVSSLLAEIRHQLLEGLADAQSGS